MKPQLVAWTLLFVSVVPIGAQDAVDLHIEAVGGASALAAIQSMERSGRAEVVTPQGEFPSSYREVYDLVGDRGSTSLNSAFFNVQTGWAEREGWRDHSLEGFSRMDPAALALAKLRSSPSVIASVLRQYGRAALQPLEECVYEGEPCDVVRFVGSPTEVLLSRESHMIVALVIPDFITYHFRDYQDESGFLLPREVIVQIPSQGLSVTYDYRKTVFDGKLKDRLFKNPRPNKE
ncbi:MAG: hypothetical protein AAF690_21710 [Acidobacteriota bacterium]